MADDLIEVLEQSKLLRNMPQEALEPLAEAAVTTQFATGDVIFDAGDEGDTLYVIRSGVVELCTAADGERLATLPAGRAFGELAVFGSEPRSTAAVARTACDLVAVRRDMLVNVLERSPGVLMGAVRNLARSLTDITDELDAFNRHFDEKVRERTEKVRETQLEIAHRLGMAAEFRDDDAGANVYRMTQYCRLLAAGAGLGEQAAEELLLAAPLHDVGKIGVPDSVLLKAGRLNESEWRIMQAHTTMGAQILGGSTSPEIQLAETIALQHHEKWDGTGYPNGLAGEDIALEARICTVADVFDALTSPRPYKEPWAFDDALGLIDNSRGTMFDPELVKVFIAEEDAVREIHDASLQGTLEPQSWRPLEGPGADAGGGED